MVRRYFCSVTAGCGVIFSSIFISVDSVKIISTEHCISSQGLIVWHNENCECARLYWALYQITNMLNRTLFRSKNTTFFDVSDPIWLFIHWLDHFTKSIYNFYSSKGISKNIKAWIIRLNHTCDFISRTFSISADDLHMRQQSRLDHIHPLSPTQILEDVELWMITCHNCHWCINLQSGLE